MAKEKLAPGLKGFIGLYGIEKRDGKLVLYKAVSRRYFSIFGKGKKRKNYKTGTTVTEEVFDTNRKYLCMAGLHVGTASCALHFQRPGYRDHIIECLVSPDDVVCVPYEAVMPGIGGHSHEKIRCKRLEVVRWVHPRELRRLLS